MHRPKNQLHLLLITMLALDLFTHQQGHTGERPRADGYLGIWYSNQPSGDTFRYKYSGGLGTYPQQLHPMAYYAKKVDRTFFCYGGRPEQKNNLLHMVSYFDHATGTVPKPIILLDKKTDDAHDNPTMMLDDDGHIWIFSNAHGTARPSYIHRSRAPHSIEDFELILTTNFSYGQPWHFAGNGFLFLHTRYQSGRRLFSMTSADGRTWSKPRLLATVDKGHYQISWRHGARVGTAFNYHPHPVGLNARTNLYYMETADYGRTWMAAHGPRVPVPVRAASNPALVHDYSARKRLVYLKDLVFDQGGRPVILYLTSSNYRSGPKSGTRTWHTAHWRGTSWAINDITSSDHNYDHGSLFVEKDGIWRLIAPTDPGPQPHCTGGEIVMWTSEDQGSTWMRARQLTRNSVHNHTYVRKPVNAHPDFYALWADGNPLQPSASRLYFTDRNGQVRQLPAVMTGSVASPEVIDTASKTAPEQGGGGAPSERK